MSQDHIVTMKNKETGNVYHTRKNRKQNPDPLTLKKYDRKLRKHVVYKESK
ncbi:MAG: 50S ribosomal protein L33 [Candidatus Kaiserbacteria bacterium]|nr:50S ribosomal protein L33 [Candidatus Kaiserbacteria bacterium]